MGEDTGSGRRGLLGRVRRKVKGGLQKVKEGVGAIHEEAKHPGRPPSYQAAASPFWQADDQRMPKGEGPVTSPAQEATARLAAEQAAHGARSSSKPTAPKPRAPAKDAAKDAAKDPTQDLPKPTDRTDRDGEPFWFLEGEDDLDGWDQTNPSETWREIHGVEGNEG